MKTTRLLCVVCLLIFGSFPLFAQTLVMSDDTQTKVYASAATTTANNESTSKELSYQQSYDTGFPANANTLLQIVFNDLNGNHLANTPAYITNVVKATLEYVPTYKIYSVVLTPNPALNRDPHDVDEANAFLANKLPTKQTCLTVMRRDAKTVVLANGAVLRVAGLASLWPKVGESACVCARGLVAAKGSHMMRLEAKKRCDTKK
jgi:hypothetical protein